MGNTLINNLQKYYKNQLHSNFNNIYTLKELYGFYKLNKIQYANLTPNCKYFNITLNCFTVKDAYQNDQSTQNLIEFTNLYFQLIPLFYNQSFRSNYFVYDLETEYQAEFNRTSNFNQGLETSYWYNISQHTQFYWTPYYQNNQNQLIITFFLLVQDKLYLGLHAQVEQDAINKGLENIYSNSINIQLINYDGQIMQGSKNSQGNEIVYLQNTSSTGFNDHTLQIILQYNKNEEQNNLNQCQTLQLFQKQLCLIGDKNEKYVAFTKSLINDGIFLLLTINSNDVYNYYEMYLEAINNIILFQVNIFLFLYGLIIFICLCFSIILVQILNKQLRHLEQFASNYVKSSNFHYKNQLIQSFIYKNQYQRNCIHQLNKAFQNLVIMHRSNRNCNRQQILISNNNQFSQDQSLYKRYYVKSLFRSLAQLNN